MRKIILFLLLFTMLLGFPTTIYAENEQIDTIKIGLYYGSSAKESIVIGSDSGFYMGAEVNGEFIKDGDLSENQVEVTVGDGTDIKIGAYTYSADQFPTLYPADNGIISIGGTKYRGGVQFKRINGGNLTVINIVGIEPYLYSVIGKEMSPSWNIEALKAQAVCARGFAISNYNKFAKYGFNLDDTTNSQVYKGISTETESTRRAADETKGQVLKHGGSIIQSIYCASMGGATANAENVWGGSYPYLVSVKDPYENPKEATRYSWEVTLTKDEIRKALASSSVNIGDIVNVTIDEQDSAGYVTKLTFHGTEGSYTAKRSSCRTIFGGKLHSQRYNIKGTEKPSPKITFAADSIPLNNGNMPSAFGKGVWSIFTAISQGIKAEAGQAVSLANSNEYTFVGNGWGHGVGMSQWGAKAMADGGHTYEDILTFYYTGTYLENIY